ncbi:histidinol-phosphate transaminase [Ochrobactrum sp. SFR4]|uniref:histidinol-phosphate transaminase n=1 Tax=Ochrobactrum sp. SFR4 TaxID=2717368 RepID=UPI001C8B11FD|nr:histidinol-phosphate transaminase [Ochrobactrum sp. SFR4]MBX8827387.1 histidinol-phosphate transaminase [Ochrobactrum sp. SFR4]
MQTVQKASLHPRPEVVALPPYNAGISPAVAQKISGLDVVAALASNENPYGTSPVVPAALASLELSRYSDSSSLTLRKALADKLGASPERIVCGNGSEELIAALSRAYLEKGDNVLTIAPCFGLHEIEPMAAGANVIKIPMTTSFGYDVDALIRELGKVPKIVFISSPSNPVGTALSRPELERLLNAVQPGTLFVLDEAYFELIDTDCPNGLEVLKERSKLSWVVLRTFSKAYGLAGLRVGYGIASDEVIAQAMRSVLTPFNVNAAAQAAAVAAFRDEGWMLNAVAKIRHDRAILSEQLAATGLHIIPSQTNFLFFDAGREAAPVAKALLKKGVIVKAWMEEGYKNFLRVSVGKASDNEKFIQALTQILSDDCGGGQS